MIHPSKMTHDMLRAHRDAEWRHKKGDNNFVKEYCDRMLRMGPESYREYLLRGIENGNTPTDHGI